MCAIHFRQAGVWAARRGLTQPLTTTQLGKTTEKVRMVQKALSKIVGAKYIAIVRAWVPNMVAWGTVGGVAIVHFTDWRVILDYVPYVNGKFKSDE